MTIGCDDDTDDTGTVGDGSRVGMTATVAGVRYAFETDFSEYVDDVLLISGRLLDPNSGTLRTIEIRLSNPSIGEYSFSKENVLQSAEYSFGQLAGEPLIWNAVSGTVILTQFNVAVAQGTFNFSAESDLGGPLLEVTDGVFDFTY